MTRRNDGEKQRHEPGTDVEPRDEAEHRGRGRRGTESARDAGDVDAGVFAGLDARVLLAEAAAHEKEDDVDGDAAAVGGSESGNGRT